MPCANAWLWGMGAKIRQGLPDFTELMPEITHEWGVQKGCEERKVKENIEMYSGSVRSSHTFRKELTGESHLQQMTKSVVMKCISVMQPAKNDAYKLGMRAGSRVLVLAFEY